MQFSLQCSKTLRASPQDASACDVSLDNFGLNEFFKYVPSFGKVWMRPSCILLLAFDFSYFLSVSFQIVKQAASLKRKEKVGYRSLCPKTLRLNILSHVVIENTQVPAFLALCVFVRTKTYGATTVYFHVKPTV